jgi:ABC-type anion transport system duplicated permease subunit
MRPAESKTRILFRRWRSRPWQPIGVESSRPFTKFVEDHEIWAVAINAQSGFQTVSPALRMSRLNIGLRGWRLVFFILVPAALPSILTGPDRWRALDLSEVGARHERDVEAGGLLRILRKPEAGADFRH